jgi:hypothetical protein
VSEKASQCNHGNWEKKDRGFKLLMDNCFLNSHSCGERLEGGRERGERESEREGEREGEKGRGRERERERERGGGRGERSRRRAYNIKLIMY